MRNIFIRWSRLSELRKATLVFLLCSIFQKSISIISTPIFTRLMNATDYGLFSMYQAWLSLIAIITTFRLDYDVFNKGMTKFASRKADYTSTMQIITSIITFFCFEIYLIFSDQINDFLGLPTIIVYAIFLELFFMPALSFWTLKERYEYKYKVVFLVTVMISTMNIICGIIAVYFNEDDKGIARILSCVFVQVLVGFIIYVYNVKKASRVFVMEYAKFALVFNIPLIPHYFSSYILSLADRVMIQHMQGLAEAGIYSVVYSAGLVMTMFTNALNNSLIPWQYKSLDNKKFESIKGRIKDILLLLCFMLLVYIFMAPEILKIFASEEFFDGIYVIPPVSVSVFCIFVYNMACNVEFYYDKNKFTMILTAISAVTNIILNIIFIKLYGYIGAGYTTLFCYLLTMFAHIIYANKVSIIANGTKIYDVCYILKLTILLIASTAIISFLYSVAIVRYSVLIIVFITMSMNYKKIRDVIARIFH